MLYQVLSSDSNLKHYLQQFKDERRTLRLFSVENNPKFLNPFHKDQFQFWSKLIMDLCKFKPNFLLDTGEARCPYMFEWRELKTKLSLSLPGETFLRQPANLEKVLSLMLDYGLIYESRYFRNKFSYLSQSWLSSIFSSTYTYFTSPRVDLGSDLNYRFVIKSNLEQVVQVVSNYFNKEWYTHQYTDTLLPVEEVRILVNSSFKHHQSYLATVNCIQFRPYDFEVLLTGLTWVGCYVDLDLSIKFPKPDHRGGETQGRAELFREVDRGVLALKKALSSGSKQTFAMENELKGCLVQLKQPSLLQGKVTYLKKKAITAKRMLDAKYKTQTTLNDILWSIKLSVDNQQVLQAYRAGKDTLKGMASDLDQVEDTMDQLVELVRRSEACSSTITHPIDAVEESQLEAELEAELEALLQDSSHPRKPQRAPPGSAEAGDLAKRFKALDLAQRGLAPLPDLDGLANLPPAPTPPPRIPLREGGYPLEPSQVSTPGIQPNPVRLVSPLQGVQVPPPQLNPTSPPANPSDPSPSSLPPPQPSNYPRPRTPAAVQSLLEGEAENSISDGKRPVPNPPTKQSGTAGVPGKDVLGPSVPNSNPGAPTSPLPWDGNLPVWEDRRPPPQPLPRLTLSGRVANLSPNRMLPIEVKLADVGPLPSYLSWSTVPNWEERTRLTVPPPSVPLPRGIPLDHTNLDKDSAAPELKLKPKVSNYPSTPTTSVHPKSNLNPPPSNHFTPPPSPLKKLRRFTGKLVKDPTHSHPNPTLNFNDKVKDKDKDKPNFGKKVGKPNPGNCSTTQRRPNSNR